MNPVEATMVHEAILADPRLAWSISETAKLLGVTHTTVRRWIALGRLKPIETSGWIRISQHEINRFLGL